jgi:arylsulfatase
MRIGVQLRGRKADGDGILVASGSGQGGYCLHLAQGRPVFEHHALGQRSLVASATPLPEGDSLVGVVIERAADGSAGVRLTLDGRVLAEGRLPLTIAHPSFWGLDVGRDPVSPTSATAAAHPGLPAGVLETVTLEFLEAMTEEELAELLAQTD